MPRSSIFSFDTLRSFRFRLDQTLIIVLALFCISEIGLRLAAGSNTSSTLLGTIRDLKPQGYFPPPHQFHPDIGYLYKPNHCGRFIRTDYDAEMITNELGFHSASFTEKKPEGVYRVALIGDSMLAANQVSIEQTWASQLQKQLDPIAGRKIEIINFGMDGFLPWNIRQLLQHKILGYQPDAVVYWCSFRRLTIGAERYRIAINNGTILEGSDANILLQHASLEERRAVSLRRLIPEQLFLAKLLNHVCGKVAPANIQRIKEDSYDRHDPVQLLADMKNLCDQRNIPLAMFYRLHTAEVDPDAENDFCNMLGIPAWSDINLVEDFSSLSWPHDAHFDIEGNATYAEKIAPVFQKMLERLTERK